MKHLPSLFSLLSALLLTVGIACIALSLLLMLFSPLPSDVALARETALGMSGLIALVLAVFCLQAACHCSTRLFERNRVLRAAERERERDRARSRYISEMLEQYPTLADPGQLHALPWYTLCAVSAYCHYGHYECAQALVQEWNAAEHTRGE